MSATALPKVYISGTQLGDIGVLGFAVAEDGEQLAEHLCSHRGYIRHDVHDRRPETYDAKFGGHTPGEHYELVEIGSWADAPEEVRAANKAWATSDDA